MKNKNSKPRPVYLNLLRIRQPVTALASIGHRISGVLIFLSLPFVIWMFDRSLASAEGYAQVSALLQMPLIKILSLLLAWALAHHLLAGIRFLLLDIDVGIELNKARMGAWLVNAGGLVAVLLAAVVII